LSRGRKSSKHSGYDLVELMEVHGAHTDAGCERSCERLCV
jgi:hypothetical protein